MNPVCAWNLIYIGQCNYDTSAQASSWPKFIILSLLLLFIELDKILLGIYSMSFVICVIDCTSDQECYRSHDMYWYKSILYFRMRLLLRSTWLSVYYCCTLIFQVAWTLWVILVNWVILLLSSFLLCNSTAQKFDQVW